MSAGPEQHVDPNAINETRRQIQRLFEEVARLSELDLLPADFFGEFLKRVLTALAAPAGAVWVRTPQGNLQLQYQINLQNLGLDRTDETRQSHNELLRVAFQQPRPFHLPPHSYAGQPEAGKAAAGNPTDSLLLLVPIQVESQVDGLLEVWQAPDRNPAAVNGFLQFMVEMCQLASRYLRNTKMRQMAGQQALWTQLEAFARTVHGSLNPVEVAYLIANEGRRLIDCDRVSVAVRYARKARAEAVSGADVVERRSNLIQLMQKLFDRVLAWGEKLVYTGNKDEGLPPDVMTALDEYLTESNSKLLVVMPLKDEREKDGKKPPRAVMMMECFEPPASPEQLVARLDVVGKHAAPALYNAVEHKRIPMRFLWVPLAKVQEGLGGKARAITALVAAGLVALAGVLFFVPYQLKMDAQGNLLPVERVFLYSPSTKGAFVEDIAIMPGDKVEPGRSLIKLKDYELSKDLLEVNGEIEGTSKQLTQVEAQLNGAALSDQTRNELIVEKIKLESQKEPRLKQRDEIIKQYNALVDEPGAFWVKAPRFPVGMRAADGKDPLWTVLTPDFRENLRKRFIEPKDPLLRLGNKEGRWEVEVRVPQKHIGQVLYAYKYRSEQEGRPVDELDVDLILRSDPTHTYRGKLDKGRIANQADPHKDDNNEAEPVVLAWVRIEGDDIPADKRIPRDQMLMLTGTEVKAKVLCGRHKMGYSLFYGVWEFFYEKVVFFF